MVRAVIGFAVYLFMAPAMLFACAGTLRWTMAWAHTAFLLLSAASSRLIVWRRSPELIRERASFGKAEGAKSWDRVLVPIVALVGPALAAVVAGLDHRYGWLPELRLGWQVSAAVLVAAGYALAVWAMVANRFYSAVVRIQSDRAHEVVTGGPYRLVRHPSYAGALISYLAFPVMLDALWALVPSVGVVAVLILRTALEDRTLLAELEGYRAYAERTRFRLVPGIW